VELFREHKLIKKDHQIFIAFIGEIFPEVQRGTPGTFDLEELKSKW
jgi:hypothetical protein